MTRLLVVGALALAGLGWAGQAEAMTSLMGGRTLGVQGEQRAARAEVGWPGMRLTYVIPFTEHLDISPQLGFLYGHNLRAGMVGFEPGFEIRWSVWRRGAWSAAVVADPALRLHIPTDGTRGDLGVRIGGPGLVMGWQVAQRISVSGGLRIPLATTLVPDRTLTIPVLAEASLEMELYGDEDITMQATGLLSVGPEYCVGPCTPADIGVKLALGAVVFW